MAQDDSQRFRPTFSEALLTSILDAALDAVITVDAEGAVLTWSAQAERMFGWAAADVVGRTLATTIIPPRYREQHEQALARMRAGGQPTMLNRRLELTALHQDGHEIPVELTVTRVPLHDGWLFSAFVRDLTELKRSEHESRRTTDFLHTVIDAAPLAIFAMDAAGLVQTWNPAAERLFGWSAQEAIGRFLPTVPKDSLVEFMGLRRRVLANEQITGIALIHRKKDGGWVNVNLFAAPLHDAEGRVTGILGVVEDVTAVKRLERQFFQAQKMEAVGRLAGGVAHDFNNLLTVIMGGCDLLLMEDFPEPQREDLRQIRKAADRATSLTRQLLAFSRQQQLAPQIVDLNDVAAKVESLLQPLLGKDIELRRIAGPELGAIEADPNQLEQVMMNLAVNALDAMPNGGTLTIETANVELDVAFAESHPPLVPGLYVRLTVRDTGTGMSEHTRAHLFEPFFTTKERGKGAGLGLAAVYGIVKQSGGYIDASDEPNGGTAFAVYLPRVGPR